MQSANRMRVIKESPTLAIAAKAEQMRLAGIDVINLSAGEPDFDTHDTIKASAIEAIKNGFTKYTAVTGTLSLKKAIIEKFKKDSSISYELSEVMVSAGAKQAFYNLCMAYLNPTDEVIIPAPFWVSYPDMVSLAGGVPVSVLCPAKDHYKLTARTLKETITDKTRLLIINSPNNPTGAVYTKEELNALAKILLGNPQILIASDNIYEHLLLKPTVRFFSILDAEPRLKNQTLLISGVSKSYAMTGWRIGYAAGPAWLIKAMADIQSQSTSNPCSISQVAAEAALKGDQTYQRTMQKAFRERHEQLMKYLASIKQLKYWPAEGAFYAFIDAKEAIAYLFSQKKISQKDDVAFSKYLLDQYHLAVVPGSAFGFANHFRISFATSMESLEKGLVRLRKALES